MSIFEQYVELHTAVERVADIFDGMDIGYETFSDFTCDEIEVIGAMLNSAGRAETASRILDRHADGDEPDDAHYKGNEKASPAEPTKPPSRDSIPYLWRQDHPGEHRLSIYGQSSADGWCCWGCQWQYSALLTTEQAEALHAEHVEAAGM